MTHVEITTGPRLNAVIKLDGHDISAGVKGYEVKHEAPHLRPVLLIAPAMFDRLSVSVEADVYISPEASDLLCRLGWTPPGGAS